MSGATKLWLGIFIILYSSICIYVLESPENCITSTTTILDWVLSIVLVIPAVVVIVINLLGTVGIVISIFDDDIDIIYRDTEDVFEESWEYFILPFWILYFVLRINKWANRVL